MRNIHVIPTDKPSRLHITSKLRLYPNGLTPKSQGLCKNQNMYITSDEIVTEYSTGLYFIDVYTGRNDVFSPIKIDKDSIHAAPFHSYMNNGNMCKKIILTTDQDLIKDGVQAIEEDFLNWFVKNPSCEFVNIKLFKKFEGENEVESIYKIIIPKEEPKIISDWLEQNRNPEIDKQVEKEADQLSKQETLEEKLDKIVSKEPSKFWKESDERLEVNKSMADEIKTIEYTLKSIFKKDEITSDDVISANRLFKKWKKLTKYKEDTSFIVESVLDNEPIWQVKQIEK